METRDAGGGSLTSSADDRAVTAPAAAAPALAGAATAGAAAAATAGMARVVAGEAEGAAGAAGGQVAAAAAAAASASGGADNAVRNPRKKHKHTQHRRDDGRGKRPRKGDAKRARKEKALAQAAEKCQYYVDDHGLRRVRPYTYDFQTHAKERWLERSVIDVFTAEFGGEPRSHYENAIRIGLLTVNGRKVGLDYKIQNGDLISNRTHRHEPPVCGGDIPIVSESEGELVVDKPCTVPIHPCGSYRFNSLFYILQRQRPDLSLRVCHRLDRLTSGLTILAKTAERAGVIQTQIGSGETKKTYLARVSGDFGRRLPANRREPGSPSSPSAAAAAAAPAMSEEPSSLPPPSVKMGRMELSGSVRSPEEEEEEGGNPASETTAGGGAGAGAGHTGQASSVVPATSNGGKVVAGGEGEAEGKGELWWRYEFLGPGVVKDRAPSGASAAPGSDAATVGCAASGGTAAGVVPAGSGGGGGGGGAEAETLTVRVNCPIRVVDHKHGVYECHPLGKEAQTTIRKVEYDPASDTSVVECTPVHGRTHQIRLHLQWVGHPIANDPCYGGELHFGNPEAKRRAEENPGFEGWKGVPGGSSRALKGRRGDEESARQPLSSSAAVGKGITAAAGAAAAPSAGAEAELVDGGSAQQQQQHDTAVASALHGTSAPAAAASPGTAPGGAYAAAKESEAPSTEAGVVPGEAAGAQRDGEDDEAFMARTCSMCQSGERFLETQLHCVGIWLHALRYEGPDWAFETEMPSWATF